MGSWHRGIQGEHIKAQARPLWGSAGYHRRLSCAWNQGHDGSDHAGHNREPARLRLVLPHASPALDVSREGDKPGSKDRI